MDKNICALLQEIKIKTNWSQPRLATELGISQATVSRILDGQPDCKGRTLVSISDLHKKYCLKKKSNQAHQ